jgi:hypothetical protein
MTNEASWREHFSVNAGDLIQIHRAFCGPEIAQRIMMECFKSRPRSGRINETTVCAVLHELNIWIDEDGNSFIKGRE